MKELKATAKVTKFLEELRIIIRTLAKLNADKERIVAEIKEFMETGNADALFDSTGKMLLGILQTRGGNLKFDTASFKELHPKLFEEFQKPTDTYKVFLPK